MGVKSLWDIVAPSGIRIRAESLEGQILAIDASIWLKQFLIGMKDEEGKLPFGAHLLGFFKRICKLLYYGILPIIVFDGTPPEIKRKTLEVRRMQREISEINMRRVANKLLLNSIRLRVAKKIKNKVNNIPEDIKKDDNYIQSECNTENLFSSSEESEEEIDNIRKDDIINNFEENDNNKDSTSLFPILGFLSERRRLDEMPEIDSNLFKMPISLNSKYKNKSRRFGNIEDFNVYIRKNSEHGNERRLMDLPLDTEIDPQVFEQLNSKLQYEILVQLKDAWMSALRTNAVDTKDNMNQFSNSQIECYLRYLRINQEIEKLKLKMAKECEDEKLDNENNNSYEKEKKNFVEYGEVYDPDEDNLNNKTSSSIENSDNFQYDENGLTLTDKLLSYSNKSNNESFNKNLFNSNNKMENIYNNSIKFTKKERIKFLQSTNYYNSQMNNSIPLNTSLFDLEKLLNFQYNHKKNDQQIIFKDVEDLNNKQRLDLLKEDVEDLFSFKNEKSPNINKDFCMKNTEFISENYQVNQNEKDEDWEDIEWVHTSKNKNIKENLDEKHTDFFKKSTYPTELDFSIEFDSEKILKNNMINQLDKNFKDIQTDNNKYDLKKLENNSNILEIEENTINSNKNLNINEITSNKLTNDFEDFKEFNSESFKTTELEKTRNSEELIDLKKYTSDHIESTENYIIDEKSDQEENSEIFQNEENFLSSNDSLDLKKEAENFEFFDKKECEILKSDVLNLESDLEQSKKTDEHSNFNQNFTTPKKLDESFQDNIDDDIKEMIEIENNLLFNESEFFEKSIDDIMIELEEEQQKLTSQFNKQDIILNAELTKEMQVQICSLLQAFGIPWIESPGEAEAQASILTKLNICHGVISEDSDCLIFGAKKIYRNFFSGTSIEMYDIDHVKKFLNIKKQEQIYILALLLGCDYTVGVNGIGPVNAVEILKAYPNLEDMILLRDWSMSKLEDKQTDLIHDSIERIEFKKNHSNYRHSWVFPSDFPCLNAINAMRNPSVNYKFQPVFGDINKDLIIDIMTKNTYLTDEKINIIIDPIIKNQKNRSKQTKIDQFLFKGNYIKKRDYKDYLTSNKKELVANIVSKRMKKALIK